MAGFLGKNLKDKAFVQEVSYSLTHIRGLTIEPLKVSDLSGAVELMDANG